MTITEAYEDVLADLKRVRQNRKAALTRALKAPEDEFSLQAVRQAENAVHVLADVIEEVTKIHKSKLRRIYSRRFGNKRTK